MSRSETPIEFQNIALSSRAIHTLKAEVVQAKNDYEELKASNLEKINPKKDAIENSLINLFKNKGYKEILLNKSFAEHYYKSHQVGSYINFNMYLSELFEKDYKGFIFSQKRINSKNSAGDRVISLEIFLDYSESNKLSIKALDLVSSFINSLFEIMRDSLGVESFEKTFLNVRGNLLKRVGNGWEFIDSKSLSVWGLIDDVEDVSPVESLIGKLMISLSVKK